MDIQQIPKIFWYSLSFSIICATLGLLFIAYRSTSVSIEIANAKIELSSALSTTKEIKSGLEEEDDNLKRARKELEDKVEELQTLVESRPAGGISVEELKTHEIFKRPSSEVEKIEIPMEKFKILDQKIQSVQQSIAK